MFLKPLSVYFNLQFTALHLDVPSLSCTPPNTACLSVSFKAITLPRPVRFTPAQFQRVPHHPGCNVKSYGTLLQVLRVFRPIRQRLRGHPHAKMGMHGRSCDFLS